MSVQEFECQMARGQIGRYLGGEGLSSEGLRQLGMHVAECSGCKIFLDQRKATLQGMLGEAPMPAPRPVQAVVEVKPSEALIAQIRARSSELEPEPTPNRKPKPIVTKPVIYCGVLSVVLVAMTYVSRNPTGFLGPSAAQAVAAKAAPVTAQPEKTSEPTASVAKAIATPPKTDAPPASSPKAKALLAKAPSKPGIDPTAKTIQSPIKIDSAKPKPAAKTKPTHTRLKARARRRHNVDHLAPGTGAIHIYTPIR